MKLFLVKPRGFCAGVVRAIKIVKRSLEKWGSPIYVKHYIVHNKQVIDSLKKEGIIFVEDLKNVPKYSKIIYSAHGVSPDDRIEAKKLSLFEIDATCPLVTKNHRAVVEYSQKGYKIILIGDKKHIEVIATKKEAEKDIFVVESLKDIEKLNFSKREKLVYLIQTTFSSDDVKIIEEELKKKYPDIKSLSSICYATSNRQNAFKSIIDLVDLALIVGDSMSSNSNKLKDIALKNGVKAFLINDPSEIFFHWFKNVSKIGLTAGASTPEDVIESCIDRLKDFGVKEIENKIFIEERVVFSI
ncbi:MAG: 4-hydroxy-3-methylbut-2-enyl diphosphate reductase [Chlamydiae bacterium SM23_39]|nr:MAG: 4-hydroxy-3-methylbut-2-enyl diphosphate reductase [Chlamydiae bacterium SM23_39]